MIAHQNAVIKEAVYMEGVEKYQDRQRKERERKFLPETALKQKVRKLGRRFRGNLDDRM